MIDLAGDGMDLCEDCADDVRDAGRCESCGDLGTATALSIVPGAGRYCVFCAEEAGR